MNLGSVGNTPDEFRRLIHNQARDLDVQLSTMEVLSGNRPVTSSFFLSVFKRLSLWNPISNLVSFTNAVFFEVRISYAFSLLRVHLMSSLLDTPDALPASQRAIAMRSLWAS